MNFYPKVGFHFVVTFRMPLQSVYDVAFQSVSGLNVSLETETFKEGGENRFEHVLPGRTKYTDLVLKRGILTPFESGITIWCKNAFENFIIEPIDIDVILLNDLHLPVIHWRVHHAWPKSWKVGDLNAEKGEVLIETLELNYNHFSMNGI